MRKSGKVKTVLVILAICSVLFIVSIFFLPEWWSSLFSPLFTPPSIAPPSVTPPSAPSNLMAQAVSQSQVELHWVDNSGNEDGFRIYRDNSVIATVGENANLYRDTGLRAATTYHYAIEAYNTAGGSEADCTITTRNPGITVTLNEIGVYFDHDPGPRGRGEIYLGVVVTDGVKTERWEIPQQIEGIPHYSLNDNEAVSVGVQIFSTKEVGDYLRIFVIAYESDGGDFEMLVYQALGVAASTWMAGEVGMDLLGVFGVSLGELIGSFFGTEDDFVGSYERSWDKTSWWGAHEEMKTSYLNAGSEDLSLCFTIESE